jgi:GH43 family beta-xylosidase
VSFQNPIIRGAPGDDHGDPFIVRYLDSYFLYHTGETSGRRGVSVHRSADLVEWEFQGFALEAAETGWAWSDLWAPEVVYERGTFYMYVSATRRRPGRRRSRWDEGASDDRGRHVGVARSTSPLGPFVWDDVPLVDSWSIDAHPFRDDDGALWLFYNTRNELTCYPDGTPGTAIVADRLLAPDQLQLRPRPTVSPSQRWEGNREGDFYWNEAPYVLKRRGVYHLMYSGGHFRDETYGIGLARSPSAFGPWTKLPENPIVAGTTEIAGPGHHSFVFGPDAASRYAVYHGYVPGDSGRKVHLDRMRWVGDRPFVIGPTHDEQPHPPQPVYDEAVPHWVAETWARGSWIDVHGRRFELEQTDVWHQVEVEHSDGRTSTRIGGVLRASYPSEGGRAGPQFGGDCELGPTTVSTCGTDPGLRDLPARSTYVWRWGGSAAVELALAVRGDVTVRVGDAGLESHGDPARFRLVELTAPHGGATIVAEAGAGGATVTDLVAYARA